MAFDPRGAQEIRDDGLLIENGALFISGQGSPNSIPMNVPAFYFETTGDIHYHKGTGSWKQLQIGGGAFNEDLVLFGYDGTVCCDQNYNMLLGV